MDEVVKKKKGRPPKIKEQDVRSAESVIQTSYFERSRTYFYPIPNPSTKEISIVPIELKLVTDIRIKPNGTHVVKANDKFYIMPTGWISIEIE